MDDAEERRLKKISKSSGSLASFRTTSRRQTPLWSAVTNEEAAPLVAVGVALE
jgi:hypothetical protein